MNPKDLLKKYYHFAIVGVSPNKEKYGYKIYARLKERGYDVFGVSPIYHQIDNEQLYPCLENIPSPIDCVVFVCAKEHVYSYIDEMSGLGIHYAWLQPHTYDEQLLEYIKEQGITPILACVLIETS